MRPRVDVGVHPKTLGCCPTSTTGALSVSKECVCCATEKSDICKRRLKSVFAPIENLWKSTASQEVCK